MDIAIDQTDIQQYAEERMKTVVNAQITQKVNAVLKEWDFYRKIDNMI